MRNKHAGCRFSTVVLFASAVLKRGSSVTAALPPEFQRPSLERGLWPLRLPDVKPPCKLALGEQPGALLFRLQLIPDGTCADRNARRVGRRRRAKRNSYRSPQAPAVGVVGGGPKRLPMETVTMPRFGPCPVPSLSPMVPVPASGMVLGSSGMMVVVAEEVAGRLSART